MRKLIAFCLLLSGITVFLLVVTSIYAAHQGAQIEGLPVVRCDPARQEVLAAIGGTVFVLDEHGQIRRRLYAEDKRPIEISDLDWAPSGGYLLAEGTKARLLAFDENGTPRGPILSGKDRFEMNFEILPLESGNIVVADTIAHRLRLISPTGIQLKEVKGCLYPNGVMRWAPNIIAVMCTGSASIAAYDDNLESIPPTTDPLLATAAPRQKSGHHYVLARTPQYVYRDHCDTMPGIDCSIQRIEPKVGTPSLIAVTGGAALPTTNLEYDLRELTFCVTSRGTIIAASNRYTALLEISDGHGGAPAVLPASSTRPRLRAAELDAGGMQMAPNNVVRRFGDAETQGAVAKVLAGRIRFDRLESAARNGIYLLLGFFLLIFGFDRWIGRKSGGSSVIDAVNERFVLLWNQIIARDITNFALYFGTVCAVFAVVGLFGLWLAGWGIGITLGILAARSIGRRVAAPRLLANRDPELAIRAFEIHLGARSTRGTVLQEGEHVIAASLALPVTRFEVKEVVEIFGQQTVGVPDDPWDVLDAFSPQLQALVLTDRRLLSYPCDLLGTPRGVIRSATRTPDGGPVLAREQYVVLPSLAAYRSVGPELMRALASVRVGRPRAICPHCLRRPACEHRGDVRAPAMALGALFPGSGHLVLGEYARGRLLLTIFVILGLQVAGMLLSLYYGTLPISLKQLAVAMIVLPGFWLFALFDLQRLLRDRAAL